MGQKILQTKYMRKWSLSEHHSRAMLTAEVFKRQALRWSYLYHRAINQRSLVVADYLERVKEERRKMLHTMQRAFNELH